MSRSIQMLDIFIDPDEAGAKKQEMLRSHAYVMSRIQSAK